MMISAIVPFSVIAATMAFLITYEEMARHYAGRQRPLRAALRTALFTMIFFLIISWLVVKVLLPGRV